MHSIILGCKIAKELSPIKWIQHFWEERKSLIALFKANGLIEWVSDCVSFCRTNRWIKLKYKEWIQNFCHFTRLYLLFSKPIPEWVFWVFSLFSFISPGGPKRFHSKEKNNHLFIIIFIFIADFRVSSSSSSSVLRAVEQIQGFKIGREGQ